MELLTKALKNQKKKKKLQNNYPVQKVFILGIGNPEEKYNNTRHNIGKDWVEKIAKDHDLTFAKKSKLNLVVGVEKTTDRTTSEAGDILLGASYRKEEDKINGGFAGVFAQITDAYFQKFGDKSKYLSKISAKNHKNVHRNHFRNR